MTRDPIITLDSSDLHGYFTGRKGFRPLPFLVEGDLPVEGVI